MRKTDGKALVLFTSHRMLAEATHRLTPWFRREKLALQSQDVSRSELLASFRSDRDSVLFGTDTFWQGVDVPGEALSNVIITKLPFSHTGDPLLEAQLEAITGRGGNRFADYLVPEGVLKLKQGIGRLIRSSADGGIVVILDPRVLNLVENRGRIGTVEESRHHVTPYAVDGLRHSWTPVEVGSPDFVKRGLSVRLPSVVLLEPP